MQPNRWFAWTTNEVLFASFPKWSLYQIDNPLLLLPLKACPGWETDPTAKEFSGVYPVYRSRIGEDRL